MAHCFCMIIREISEPATRSIAATAINKYEEYGRPASGNLGRFQYTGQMYLPETAGAASGGVGAGLYHYRARAYPGFGGASR